jgi:hypothetical protein
VRIFLKASSYAVLVIASFIAGIKYSYKPHAYGYMNIQITGGEGSLEDVKTSNHNLQEFAEKYFAAHPEIECSVFFVPGIGENKIVFYIMGVGEFPEGFIDDVLLHFGAGAHQKL